MVRRGHRRIGSRTARAMLTWSHYRFRQRLLNKAQQFPSCTVCLCDEEYTSKTCGKCGQVHHQLGGNKTFRCPQPECGYQADRDANAARNILIRFFTLQALTTSSSSSVRGR
ncbi:Transposase [Balamuthia mandrillaris]